MKKSWRLLSLLLVLCVLLGGYIFVKNTHNKKDAKKSTSTTNTNSDKSKNVYSVVSTKVKQINIKSKEADITIIKSGKKWKVNKLGDHADESSIEAAVSTLTNITADRVIEKNAKDLSEYGLDKPTSVVTVLLNNGQKQAVELGSEVPGNSMYYLKLADKNTVYAVAISYGQIFKYTLNDLRNKKLASIDTSKVNYMDLKFRNGKEAEFKTNTDSSDASYTPYKLYKYYKTPVGIDGDKFTSAIKNLSEVDFEDVVEENAKDLKKYGLDKPVLSLNIKDKSKGKINLLIGNNKDSNTVYIKEPNSNTVYTMDNSSVKSLIKLNVFSMTFKFANIVNIDLVDKVDIKSKDANYEITMNRTIKKATKKGEKDQTVTKYFINSKQIKDESFKDYYQKLIGLIVDAENDKGIKGNPEVITTFHLNKGKDIVVKYYNYNDDFYTVDKNGIHQFIIAKDKVKSMLNETAKMIK
ncbi:DUF4340 domain-containing protein [Clostridium oryzae]|uniref:DUF4340 domain-containing protein n=1 Tax=Clostridium oryzae TaxID=1450648 RepID=A0A1V4IGB0_9CLOT|nr:DUF4340 domain-containing protein [Clostridium oryzae]OPJ58993.1 hypothetical protein CLORY_34830 [Clostridium oryzae]